MSNSGFRPIFHLFWVIAVVIAWNIGTSHGMIPAMRDYFPDVAPPNITWAHGVNSKARLENELKGPVMMLEADILMGKKEGSEKEIPIMSHDHTISDLSFDDFLKKVISATQEGKKKGIKLDFKQIEAVSPVLKKLNDKMKKITFPIWINADILPGPVNATKKPVDAKLFLEAVKRYTPKATLSVGWTTRFGLDDAKSRDVQTKQTTPITVGNYSIEDVDKMLALVKEAGFEAGLEGTDITFPVRAAIAAESIDTLERLTAMAGPKSSITLWSPSYDTIDMEKLRLLIVEIGHARTYIDLPFSVDSENPNAISDDNQDKEDSDGNIDTTIIINGCPSNAVLGMSSLLMIGLAIVLGL